MNKDIIYHGDVYACLNLLKDNSIAVAITSPPYWMQRDYGFDRQIGQEKTHEEYISRLVKIYSKLREKLKEDGIFFLNIGDKYLTRYGKSHLLQIPYRLAYQMTEDGWYLEDIIIWYKPNHMPSSIKDRFANTYEPILVMAKSKKNIYKKGYSKTVEIPLQQTQWKHTATFPEELVENMLDRVSLKDGDIVLDPFAGTGTTAAVVNKMRNNLFYEQIYSVMIEKQDEFIDIIRKRTRIKEIITVKDIPYSFQNQHIKEIDIPEDVKPVLLLNDRYGEVYIADNSDEFLSLLKGFTLNKFKNFHREDAVYFLGVRNWKLDVLCYSYIIYKYGYMLRNMLVVAQNNSWYPVFMFVRHSTKVAYRFYLDRVRQMQKLKEKTEWQGKNFTKMKVKDIAEKKVEGYISKVLESYTDGFPRLVIVNWGEKLSVEFVIHPENEESLMEGIKFLCPKCYSELTEPYDLIEDTLCHFCGQQLWKSLNTVPVLKEPFEIIVVLDSINKLKEESLKDNKVNIIEMQKKKNNLTSKFALLDRINWGASPGARKLILGEYFTKMRLYRIPQPVVAQYLNLLRKSLGLTIQDIVKKLPKNYFHTAGHWFRKDFGGSIPLPEDIKLIKSVLEIHHDKFLESLERTALKFQTVKNHNKGKNPGDYIKKDNDELIKFLKVLYILTCFL